MICQSAVRFRPLGLEWTECHTAITEPVRRLEVFTGDAGLSPQQLFGSRRQSREAAGGHSEAAQVKVVPAVLVAGYRPKCLPGAQSGARADSGIIEIEVDGITIRAGRGADRAMISSIAQALKASR